MSRIRGWQGVRSKLVVNGAMVALLALWLTYVRADTLHVMASVTVWNNAKIHGHKIYYAVRGSGPTLLFLHGGGDSGEHSFMRQLDVFAEHHHIVAPDQVGQGRTPDVSGPLSYTAMMEDTAELLRKLKLQQVDPSGFQRRRHLSADARGPAS